MSESADTVTVAVVGEHVSIQRIPDVSQRSWAGAVSNLTRPLSIHVSFFTSFDPPLPFPLSITTLSHLHEAFFLFAQPLPQWCEDYDFHILYASGTYFVDVM